jgi:hypothetical protein
MWRRAGIRPRFRGVVSESVMAHSKMAPTAMKRFSPMPHTLSEFRLPGCLHTCDGRHEEDRG